MTYIYQAPNWPNFDWDIVALAPLLASVHQHQGKLLGRMETLGFKLRDEAILQTLTLDVVKNSEIENDILDPDQVRSSIARRLGIDVAGLIPSDRHTEGVVEIMLDATQLYQTTLTKQRLLGWHAALFPNGYSGMNKIVVGNWRDDEKGPMQVVSGPIGRERVHFEAPPAGQLEPEMQTFLNWFNHPSTLDPVIKAGIAHLWFVTIHPFDDGNGRIARTITDLQLARADNNSQRFYSMSAEIRLKRNAYYDHLEQTQKGTLDITAWLIWFLTCLDDALISAEKTLSGVLQKARFWETHRGHSLNKRQYLVINKLLEGFVGKLTSSKWAKIAKCSQDTALRDINELVQLNVLAKESGGGRSTSYLLRLE